MKVSKARAVSVAQYTGSGSITIILRELTENVAAHPSRRRKMH